VNKRVFFKDCTQGLLSLAHAVYSTYKIGLYNLEYFSADVLIFLTFIHLWYHEMKQGVRSHAVIIKYNINSVAEEPEGSSPHSQQLDTGPYPEPCESNPHPPAGLTKIQSGTILLSTPWSSEWSLSFGISHQYLVQFFILSHACHMSCPPHWPYLIRVMIFGDWYKLWSSSLTLNWNTC
jgi:hypothetical protein